MIGPEEDPAGQITVRLTEFEGPLDLLLHLIRKNKVDIYDIPIAEITAQYLAFLEAMRQLNLEVASEFLVMASTLILIKSKLLLPSPPAAGEEEEEDPRAELVARLLAYQAIKGAADRLRERGEEEEDYFRRQVPPPADLAGRETLEVEVSLFDLLDSFRHLLDRLAESKEVMTIFAEELSVTERMGQILALLPPGKRLALDEIIAGGGRTLVVVTFLAILEMLHRQAIKVIQSEPFGPLYLRLVEEN